MAEFLLDKYHQALDEIAALREENAKLKHPRGTWDDPRSLDAWWFEHCGEEHLVDENIKFSCCSDCGVVFQRPEEEKNAAPKS